MPDVFDLVDSLSKEHSLLESILIVIALLLALALVGLIGLLIKIVIERSALRKDLEKKDTFIMDLLMRKDNISNENLKNSVRMVNKEMQRKYTKAKLK